MKGKGNWEDAEKKRACPRHAQVIDQHPLDFNKNKRQRELKGLECLNLNTLVYGH